MDFEKGGTANVVQHPITHFGLTYPPAGSPLDIIDRAMWLVDHQPPGYHIAGRNCEHIANWCVTGKMYESFQMKWAAMGGAVLGGATLLALKRLPPKATVALATVDAVVGYFVGVQYLLDGPRFMEHIKKYAN